MASVGKVTIKHARLSYIFEIASPFHEETLLEKLANKNYRIAKDRIFRQGPIEAVLLQIAGKDGVTVVYDPAANPSYIGVESNDYAKTLKYFHELKEILDSIEMGKVDEAVIEGNVVFHVYSKKNPRKIIKKFGRSLSDKMDQIVPGLSPQLMQCTFSGRKDSEKLTIHLAPYYQTQNYYYILFSYRHEKEENVNEILKRSKDIILEYQEKIENA